MVVAVVQPHTGHTVSAPAPTAFVKTRISGIKAPNAIMLRSDLPRPEVGKVFRE